MRYHVFGEIEEGVDVCVEGIQPLVSALELARCRVRYSSALLLSWHIDLLGEVLDVLDHHLVGRIVEEDIDLAVKYLEGFINHLAAVSLIAEISG